jgi:hypothetical protein
MDMVLIAVTVMSLAMAAAMAAVVMRLLRDERRRSDARVAALSDMAAAGSRLRPAGTALRRSRPGFSAGGQSTVSDARTPDRVADLDLRASASPVAGVSELFAEPEHASPWGRRLAVIGMLAAVILATGFVLRSPGASTPPDGVPAAAAAAVPALLELVSLRHAQEEGRLTITGLVQNPHGAPPLERVAATAFAFGPDGTLLASGRARLDFITLGAGDESPFVVSVPVSGHVARYRVGFRAADGSVIAHVDRRSDVVAQK